MLRAITIGRSNIYEVFLPMENIFGFFRIHKTEPIIEDLGGGERLIYAKTEESTEFQINNGAPHFGAGFVVGFDGKEYVNSKMPAAVVVEIFRKRF